MRMRAFGRMGISMTRMNKSLGLFVGYILLVFMYF